MQIRFIENRQVTKFRPVQINPSLSVSLKISMESTALVTWNSQRNGQVLDRFIEKFQRNGQVPFRFIEMPDHFIEDCIRIPRSPFRSFAKLHSNGQVLTISLQNFNETDGFG